MQQQRFWCAKCAIACLLLALMVLPAEARTQGTYKKSSGVQHYITMSLSAGEGNTMMQTPDNLPKVHNRVGADGQFHIGYELRQTGFFFGIGVGADYDLGRQHIDSLKDNYGRYDREDDAITYTYAYRDYNDMQMSAHISIPIYIGGYLSEKLYLLGGVKFGIHMWGIHRAQTEMETYGTYKEFIHTIHRTDYYGYYKESHYEYMGLCTSAKFRITPMVEVGYKIPLETKSKRVEMRVGGYVEYGIPLSAQNDLPMVDISRTDVNPFTQNQADLRANIILNSPVTTTWQEGGKTGNLQVGVRFTCLFNVTPPKRFCMCSPDWKIFSK